MAEFQWTKKREKVVLSLALGSTVKEAADEAGVSERTVYRWKDDPYFKAEMDRLTMMTGPALRAERLRIAYKVIAGRLLTQYPKSDKDLLDWIKFVQSETDGAKLDLTALIAAAQESLAES